jgi:hypothetical protein
MRPIASEARRAGRWPALLASLGLLSPIAPAEAAGMELPADLQIPLILKVLTYDRQLESKAGGEVNIGIVYSPADPSSSQATTDVSGTLNKFAGKTVKKLPINYWTIEFVSTQRLEAILKEKNISVLYVSPGVEKHITAITQVSQSRRVTTTTGVPDFVKQGVAVGIGQRRGKPQIYINLEASKSEGSEFDASLLRIATVVP